MANQGCDRVSDPEYVAGNGAPDYLVTHRAGQGTMTSGGMTILADNAFLPDTTAVEFAENGFTQFTMGSCNADIPKRESNNERTLQRFVLGSGSNAAHLDGALPVDARRRQQRRAWHQSCTLRSSRPHVPWRIHRELGL